MTVTKTELIVRRFVEKRLNSGGVSEIKCYCDYFLSDKLEVTVGGYTEVSKTELAVKTHNGAV